MSCDYCSIVKLKNNAGEDPEIINKFVIMSSMLCEEYL